MLNLTPEDAAVILTAFGALVTLIVSWLPTLKLTDYAKFGIVVVLSTIGGYLTLVSTGQIINGGSLVQNGALVFTAAQLFYYGAFRVLGLERVLFPQQALATEVKEQAKDATPTNISNERAKDILDPSTPSEIVVTAKVK